MNIIKYISLLVPQAVLAVFSFTSFYVLADQNKQMSNEKAIFDEIAKAHSIPDDQTTLQNEASLQDRVDLQKQSNTKEQLQNGELDPTKPDNIFDSRLVNTQLSENEKDNTNLTLTAIFINKDRRIAVINGVLLKEGESIAGKKVQEISESKVKLLEKKEILELKLPSYSIREEDP
jgi:hypothetical protein